MKCNICFVHNILNTCIILYVAVLFDTFQYQRQTDHLGDLLTNGK